MKIEVMDEFGKIHYLNEDLSGRTFERLFVINLYTIKNGTAYYKCKCSCGNIKIVSRSALIENKTLSCGCLARELKIKRMTSHGMTHTRFYNIWHHIKDRCNNKNSDNYINYGERGIFVCKEWEYFENFYNDMYESYLEASYKYGENNISIDRIDYNDGYYKENCRWATMKVQLRNRRNNRVFLINNKKYVLMDAVKNFAVPGLTYGTVRDRLDAGKDIYTALTMPLNESYIHNKSNKENIIRRPIYFDIDINSEPREI